jgi:hypothetical protein
VDEPEQTFEVQEDHLPAKTFETKCNKRKPVDRGMLRVRANKKVKSTETTSTYHVKLDKDGTENVHEEKAEEDGQYDQTIEVQDPEVHDQSHEETQEGRNLKQEPNVTVSVTMDSKNVYEEKAEEDGQYGQTTEVQDPEVHDQSHEEAQEWRSLKQEPDVTISVTMEHVKTVKESAVTVLDQVEVVPIASNLHASVDALKHLQMYGTGSQSSTETMTAQTKGPPGEKVNLARMGSVQVSKSKSLGSKSVSFADQGKYNGSSNTPVRN